MGDLSTYTPTLEQNDRWVKITQLPFDPLECAQVLTEQPLVCPKCSSDVNAREFFHQFRH